MARSLGDAFDFTQDELFLNQSGNISERQMNGLQEQSKVSGCFTWIAVAVMFGSILLLLTFASSNREMTGAQQQEILPVIAGTFGLGFLIFLFFVWLGWYRARDVRGGKLSIAEGTAKLHTQSTRYGTALYVTIGKKRFQVAKKFEYNAIEADQSYRVYYVKNPPVHIILSVEKIEKLL